MNNKLLIAFFYLLIISCDNKDAIKPVTDLKDGSDSSSYALGADLGENLKPYFIAIFATLNFVWANVSDVPPQGIKYISS